MAGLLRTLFGNPTPKFDDQFVRLGVRTEPLVGWADISGYVRRAAAVRYAAELAALKDRSPKELEEIRSRDAPYPTLELPTFRVPFVAESCDREFHDPPVRSCTCGVKAYLSTEAAQHFTHRYFPIDDFEHWGLLALWGRVVENRFTCRAQFAYPIQIIAVSTRGIGSGPGYDPRRFTREEDRLRHMYGVAVTSQQSDWEPNVNTAVGFSAEPVSATSEQARRLVLEVLSSSAPGTQELTSASRRD
ncbi:MAG TPA: hypothetical protein VI056_13495 [Candidatus Limnocylindria bacterium]